jgi:hypothetical protein
MKKLIALTLVVLLVLAGCSAAGGSSKLGLGIKTTIGSSKDLAEKDDGTKVGTAQADTTVAAVMVDADGKVIDVMVDTAQTKINFNEEGVITSDKTVEYKTKRDLGNDYGMIKASGIGREWFEQMDAIQEWMKGKTAAQIAAMKVKDTEEHGIVSDETDLTSKATMGVETYLEVVAEALANAK